MRSVEGKVALVTGASSGIGYETAAALLEAGAVVYGAARRVEKMADLEGRGVRVLSMDVTKDDSVVAGVEKVLKEAGRIDILINNAGYGSYGAVEDVPIEEAKRQFEVNIFGLARLTQLVLPSMRANRFGRIVNISSMGGKIYTPFGAWYHATKHALEGWSDALRMEVKEFGVDVVIIEPGGITTAWGPISADNLRKTSGSGAYAERANKTADGMTETYASGKLTPPSVVAKTIVRAVTAGRPRTRYAVGYMAKPAIFMRGLLSDRIFDRVITSQMA